jgi:hypothetical protein
MEYIENHGQSAKTDNIFMESQHYYGSEYRLKVPGLESLQPNFVKQINPFFSFRPIRVASIIFLSNF